MAPRESIKHVCPTDAFAANETSASSIAAVKRKRRLCVIHERTRIPSTTLAPYRYHSAAFQNHQNVVCATRHWNTVTVNRSLLIQFRAEYCFVEGIPSLVDTLFFHSLSSIVPREFIAKIQCLKSNSLSIHVTTRMTHIEKTTMSTRVMKSLGVNGWNILVRWTLSAAEAHD